MHANNEKPFSPSGIDEEGFIDKLSSDELELWPNSGGPPTPLLARSLPFAHMRRPVRHVAPCKEHSGL